MMLNLNARKVVTNTAPEGSDSTCLSLTSLKIQRIYIELVCLIE